MFKKIAQFIEWLNSDDETSKTRTTSTEKNKPGQDEKIKSALTALKRSGLALPFEVWDEFVVDVVAKFDARFPTRTASMMNTAIYAVRLRRNYMLPPSCAPEDRVHREIVWNYGVFATVVLHHAKMNVLQLPQLFGENPQLAITSDGELCKAIDDALMHTDGIAPLATILRQAIASQEAFQQGATKDEINAAAERAVVTEAATRAMQEKQAQRIAEMKRADNALEIAPETPVSDFNEQFDESVMGFVQNLSESDTGAFSAIPAIVSRFFDWSATGEAMHLLIVDDENQEVFCALPRFKTFLEQEGIEAATFYKEFEAHTGATLARRQLADARHKGYIVPLDMWAF